MTAITREEIIPRQHGRPSTYGLLASARAAEQADSGELGPPSTFPPPPSLGTGHGREEAKAVCTHAIYLL